MKILILILALLLSVQTTYAANDGGSGGYEEDSLIPNNSDSDEVANDGGSGMYGNDGGSGEAGNDGGSGMYGNDGGSGIVREFNVISDALYTSLKFHETNMSVFTLKLRSSAIIAASRSIKLHSSNTSEILRRQGLHKGQIAVLINVNSWKKQSQIKKVELILGVYLEILGIEKNNTMTMIEYTILVNDTAARLELFNP